MPTVTVTGNATRGTVTSTDGKYTLVNVPSDGSLEFSYVGMRAQTVPIGGKTTMNVIMYSDTELIGRKWWSL